MEGLYLILGFIAVFAIFRLLVWIVKGFFVLLAGIITVVVVPLGIAFLMLTLFIMLFNSIFG